MNFLKGGFDMFTIAGGIILGLVGAFVGLIVFFSCLSAATYKYTVKIK